ncbi:zinc transporter [Achlya hypogyna]|uniref:Zinc transporter n=1 Tax=Achlya hypogyna TaxID=1202772 RepID=A0A1V9Z2C9_ACHHY|nr:zinc transporter [Achlya hypogyna]
MWRRGLPGALSRLGRQPAMADHRMLRRFQPLPFVRWNSGAPAGVPSNPDTSADDEDLEQKEVETLMQKVLAQSKYFKEHPEVTNSNGLVDMLTGGRLRALEDVNKAYYPGKQFKHTSQDMVIRAMAGNTAITVLKFLAYLKTGSSALLSEAIHSLVDTGNQGLLILGLRQASFQPDKKHQYGYGRAAYFWSLISALGIFWLGAGATVSHGVQCLIHPPTADELVLSWEVWAVLGASFGIDGYVLSRAVRELRATKPKDVSLYEHVKTIKDPFMMAVLLEDLAACTGVVIALGGIGASYVTGNPFWDSAASIGIGCLLGGVAVSLIRMNQRFLLGQSVDAEIEQGIKALLLSRPSIDNVYAVQSQWVGPSTFSFKAEVDFDGTYMAAQLLEIYKPVFLEAKDLRADLPLLLAWYAEDVTRLVEKEVQEVEAEIRALYPEAAFIELEPDSKDTDMRALSNLGTKSFRTSEREAMSRALAHLARTLERSQ